MRLKILCFMVVFLGGCSGGELAYTFPSLSTGRLVDLKQDSEKLEGFYMTTHLSDFIPALAKKGLPVYVCVRFLNDKRVNKKLHKSAIPLLVQASTHKTGPQAEAAVLLHPKTKGVFYYEENRVFKLPSSPFILQNTEYDILDVHFNKSYKLTHVYLKKRGVELDDISRLKPSLAPASEDLPEEPSEASQGAAKNSLDSPVLQLSSFVKLSSSSEVCSNWPALQYKLLEDVPDYLKVAYSISKEKGRASSPTNPTRRQNPPPPSAEDNRPRPPIEPPPPIDETAPYQPVSKQSN